MGDSRFQFEPDNEKRDGPNSTSVELLEDRRKFCRRHQDRALRQIQHFRPAHQTRVEIGHQVNICRRTLLQMPYLRLSKVCKNPPGTCVDQREQFFANLGILPLRDGQVGHTGIEWGPSHFLRWFKESVGLPPHAYLTQVRVEWASAQLRSGKAIADVASTLGFTDQSHLTRRLSGCSA